MKTNHKKDTLAQTRDYAMFEPHPYNRNIARTKRLEDSMRKYGYDPGFPVRCIEGKGGKLQITHGHHRFDTAVKLGIPVWYVVASKDIPLFDSEMSARSWSLEDYVVSRAHAGEMFAKQILDYREKTGLPLGSCISLLGGELACSQNRHDKVKDGTFKLSQGGQAAAVADIVQYCRKLGIKLPGWALFVGALSKCLTVEEFNVATFKAKLKSHKHLVEPRRSQDDYLDLIELVYNRQSTSRINLAFLARESAAARQATFGKFGKK